MSARKHEEEKRRLNKNDSLAKHTNASSVSLNSRDNFLRITKLPEVRLKNRIFINREENNTPFTNEMLNDRNISPLKRLKMPKNEAIQTIPTNFF